MTENDINWPELLRGTGKHVVDIAGLAAIVTLATMPVSGGNVPVYLGAIVTIVGGKKYADYKMAL